MLIAIDKGLDDLKSILISRGYNVIDIEKAKTADAILYKEKDRHPYYEVNNIQSAVSSTDSDENTAYGAILINVNGKTIDDIVSILNKRVYSPLF